MTPPHHSLFALEPQHGPSFSLSLLMQVHEAAVVVESGGDAGDAVAIRRRLRACGGGPVGTSGGGGLPPSGACTLTTSTLPVGDATDSGMDYSQPNASTCSCAPRVFRRASQGPQGRVVPFGGVRGKARSRRHRNRDEGRALLFERAAS